MVVGHLIGAVVADVVVVVMLVVLLVGGPVVVAVVMVAAAVSAEVVVVVVMVQGWGMDVIVVLRPRVVESVGRVLSAVVMVVVVPIVVVVGQVAKVVMVQEASRVRGSPIAVRPAGRIRGVENEHLQPGALLEGLDVEPDLSGQEGGEADHLAGHLVGDRL
jgi:hypothetical protein